ncbi:MAG TPA: hypothetical protein VKT25_13370 [Ktedonobacteraceae bacterium]|nr:hypothetical protein [Ktedonobacteraceae bacterium]
MDITNTQRHLIRRRLEWTLTAFFLLAALFLIVVYVAAPSIYTSTLLLNSSPADRYPLAATLFMVAILVFITILLIGIQQHWRWLFWLLLIAFGAMILEIPATILQLNGFLPNPYPTWYSLCRMGVSILAILIAVWMFSIYRRYGVWAQGKKNI